MRQNGTSRAAVIITERAEIIPLLTALELDYDKLIEVVRYADNERALCTRNDPRGFDLIMMNARAVRGLRDTFCEKRWEADETDNQGGIRNPHIKVRVIHCNFDKNAGDKFAKPTNLTDKGAASRAKVRCNRTEWLPGLPMPEEKAEYTTYVLGTYFDEERGLRAELSHPVSFGSCRYLDFKPRIILLDGSEGSPVGDVRPDRDGPTEIIDIAIKRK